MPTPAGSEPSARLAAPGGLKREELQATAAEQLGRHRNWETFPFQTGKLVGKATEAARRCWLFIIVWPQFSLKYPTLVAPTRPSLAELMDCGGFIWKVMALTQPIQENRAELQRGFMERCS